MSTWYLFITVCKNEYLVSVYNSVQEWLPGILLAEWQVSWVVQVVGPEDVGGEQDECSRTDEGLPKQNIKQWKGL